MFTHHLNISFGILAWDLSKILFNAKFIADEVILLNSTIRKRRLCLRIVHSTIKSKALRQKVSDKTHSSNH